VGLLTFKVKSSPLNQPFTRICTKSHRLLLWLKRNDCSFLRSFKSQKA